LVAERLADEKFGDEIGCSVENAEKINRQNVGMVEGRGGLRLLLETPQAIRVSRNEGGQDLDCHLSFQ
jgi:hypothetical protein